MDATGLTMRLANWIIDDPMTLLGVKSEVPSKSYFIARIEENCVF